METSHSSEQPFIDHAEVSMPQPPEELAALPVQPRYPRLKQLLTSPQQRGFIDPKPQQARLPRGRFGDRGMTPQGRLEN